MTTIITYTRTFKAILRGSVGFTVPSVNPNHYQDHLIQKACGINQYARTDMITHRAPYNNSQPDQELPWADNIPNKNGERRERFQKIKSPSSLIWHSNSALLIPERRLKQRNVNWTTLPPKSHTIIWSRQKAKIKNKQLYSLDVYFHLRTIGWCEKLPQHFRKL